MNHDLIRAAAAIAALAALAAPLAQAEGFSAGVHARAFEAAERGPDALRSFISRTRMIHGLNYADYAGAIPAADAEVAGFGVETAGYPPESVELLPVREAGPRSPAQQAADELREQILRDMLFE